MICTMNMTNFDLTVLTLLQLAHVSCLRTIYFMLVANVCVEQCFALIILSFADKTLIDDLFCFNIYCSLLKAHRWISWWQFSLFLCVSVIFLPFDKCIVITKYLILLKVKNPNYVLIGVSKYYQLLVQISGFNYDSIMITVQVSDIDLPENIPVYVFF